MERADLAIRPFTSPLQPRSICLFAATYWSNSPTDDPLITDILEPVKQCFDSLSILVSPSLWCLQSLLLLIACPRVPQLTMLITTTGRMALLLGLHQYQKHVLLLSCILAGRLESLKHALQRPASRPSLDIENFAPHLQPDTSTIFGPLYEMVAEADRARYQENTEASIRNINDSSGGGEARFEGLKELLT